METNDIPYMYHRDFPEVEDMVMVLVTLVKEVHSEVELLEYGNRPGLILHSQLCRKRMRSLRSYIREGQEMVLQVNRIDSDRGEIDLSKRNITPTDIAAFQRKYKEAYNLYKLGEYIASEIKWNWAVFNAKIILPLYSETETAYDIIKKIANNKDAMHQQFYSLFLGSDEHYQIFVKAIQNRIAVKNFMKMKADVSITCYSHHGITGIQESIRHALKNVHPNVYMKIYVKSSPIYEIIIISDIIHEDPKINMDETINNIKTKLVEYEGDIELKQYHGLELVTALPDMFQR